MVYPFVCLISLARPRRAAVAATAVLRPPHCLAPQGGILALVLLLLQHLFLY